jgi:hypothetical protein
LGYASVPDALVRLLNVRCWREADPCRNNYITPTMT